MPRRPKYKRLADLQRIKDMMLAGKTGVEIAATLNISGSVVSNNIKEIEKEWRENRFDDIDFYKTREIQHLAFLYHEAVKGWERSLIEKERKKQRISQKGATSGETPGAARTTDTQAEVTKEIPVGDSRFLETARKIREDIRTILGLNEIIIDDKRKPFKSPSEAYKELDEMFKQFGIAMPKELSDEFKK